MVFIVFLLLPFSFFSVDASRLEVIEVVWGSVQNPEKAVPGDQKIDLNVVLSNIGNKPICSLTSEIRPKIGMAFPFRNWDDKPTISSSFQGTLQPGTMTTLTFKVNIDKNAEPKSYPIDLFIQYRDCTSTSDILPVSTQTFSLNLIVHRPSAPRFVETKWLVDNQETSVGPSTGQAHLEVVLEAPSDSSISNIEGWLTLGGIGDQVSGAGRVYANYLQNVPAGAVFRLRFPVVLSEEVKLGHHQLPLDLSYRNKYGTLITAKLTIPVEIKGKPDIGYRIQTPVFKANAINLLQYVIYNNGTAPAYNVELNVRSEISFLRVLQPVYSVGTLNPQQNFTVAVPVYVDKSAEPSLYGLFSRITFKDFYGNTKSKEFYMPLVVEERFRPGFSVTTSPSYVAAATITPVSLVFTNNNPYQVRDVKITIWSTGNRLVILEGFTDIVLPSVPKGGTYIANLKVLATPEAGDSVTNLKATIEYKDQIGLTVSETFELSVAVRANIDIRLNSLVVSPQRVRPGETIDLAGDVVNEGTDPARAVKVELLGPHPFKPIGEASTFIGNVNPSQVSAFSLSFRVDESAQPGIYPVRIKVIYRNGFGETFEKERQLQYEVTARNTATVITQPTSGSSDFTSYLLIVAALSFGVVSTAIFIFRRRGRREAI